MFCIDYSKILYTFLKSKNADYITRQKNSGSTLPPPFFISH
ncbi:hypothetical protein ROSINTL182_06257 [Roseburia intestinalis L1-82]|uniref:Uncharacterized protein n=1 Tax=Roseburia intestinalis L1-82 TaxID=536231 RepID=C7G8N1_9FIRM|nr:hypothetical protein ROSINTL182_06257 [Roseburia intestinalis L1-82]